MMKIVIAVAALLALTGCDVLKEFDPNKVRFTSMPASIKDCVVTKAKSVDGETYVFARCPNSTTTVTPADKTNKAVGTITTN